MKCLVTGGAGFIGSHLTDKLLNDGHDVVVFDNLSSGVMGNFRSHVGKENFRLIKGDVLDINKIHEVMIGKDIVFHFAANSDTRSKSTDVDLQQGTIATYNVLEAMRLAGVKKIVFASSSTVYGEAKIKPTAEDYGPLHPISFYGAAKLASEGLISAFCHNFEFKAWIFRFANVIGSRMTHGVISDFIDKLRKNPHELEVLGNGRQRKPYLEVKDCVDGVLFGQKAAAEQVNCFNLGCEGSTEVDSIAKIVIKELGLRDVKIKHTSGERGWLGDISTVLFDVSKMKSLGWKAAYNSDEAVKVATQEYIKEVGFSSYKNFNKSG